MQGARAEVGEKFPSSSAALAAALRRRRAEVSREMNAGGGENGEKEECKEVSHGSHRQGLDEVRRLIEQLDGVSIKGQGSNKDGGFDCSLPSWSPVEKVLEEITSTGNGIGRRRSGHTKATLMKSAAIVSNLSPSLRRSHLIGAEALPAAVSPIPPGYSSKRSIAYGAADVCPTSPWPAYLGRIPYPAPTHRHHPVQGWHSHRRRAELW